VADPLTTTTKEDRMADRFATLRRCAFATAALFLAESAPAEPTTAPAGELVKLAAQADAYADPQSAPGHGVFTADDEAFLDDLQQRGIRFFIDEADPDTGLVPDRTRANGGPSSGVASIASVGFGLTALCIGDERGWASHDEAYGRSLRVLRFLRDKAPQEHGHFYHFLDMKTGARMWNCEASNIDTALLMAGVLTVREHFPNTELAKLATELYERVDWPWLMTSEGTLSMGWKPESRFLDAKWGDFSEGPPLILLLGLGSPTHPLPPEAWKKWRRKPVIDYGGVKFMQCPPLFTHQYPQCWFDLRGLRDDHANYFKNSQLATLAQRQWTKDELSKRFPTYGPNVWGFTACDTPTGYGGWGGPPDEGGIDGSVVPCAPGGSLGLEPRLCLDALKFMKQQYGDKGYLKYGFVDAFNPATGWYNPDVIGIDVGPVVLMAENARSGFVWKTFMANPEMQRALKIAGFRALTAEDRARTTTSVFDDARR
jgi:hypothetical protein